jgi:hypothetical protein
VPAEPVLGLLGALERLDARLSAAVAAASAAWGRGPGDDPYRGLYETPDDARAVLARGPLGPPFQLEPGQPLARADEPPFAGLAEAFGLDAFELDTLLIALAPELDARYERLYGFLADDVAQRRPTVDLVLTLLCRSREERLDARLRFGPHAPLVAGSLVAVGVGRPLAGCPISLDPQVARLLAGGVGLDPRCAPFADLTWPNGRPGEIPTDADTQTALAEVALRALERDAPLRVLLQDSDSAGRRAAAEATAAAAGTALLAADLDELPSGAGFGETLRVLMRERWLRGAVLFLERVEALSDGEERALLRALAGSGGVTILSGPRGWQPAPASSGAPLGFVRIALDAPGESTRRRFWEHALDEHGVLAPADSLDALASRFLLTRRQIGEAVAAAAAWSEAPTTKALFAAARAQSAQRLGELATKTEPRSSWDDLVLPEESLAQLRELCDWTLHRGRVLDEWGFGRRLIRGRGITALFAGASGTGKTLAAEVLAAELGLDLYRIDLAGVVSKYIGETEKNLDRIFTAAEAANAVLLFDEADALFGRRSQVRDAHDRYANIEISYLLQKMEEYEGLAVLATNLRDNLDAAFVRRLAFTISFPFPEEEERRRIWSVVWPDAVPLSDAVDFDELAALHRLSGGQIRNVALAAAYLAAARELDTVGADELEHALRREYGKAGREVAALVPAEAAA